MLSSELATRHGYVVTNDSQRLQLHVPLFTTGYNYNVRKGDPANIIQLNKDHRRRVVLQNVALKGFSGTFEILLRDPETSEVHRSITKTCPFSPSQYICKNVSTTAGWGCFESD